MKHKSWTICLLVLLLGVASTAWAKDAIQESVANATGSPIITVNGNPYSQGTYAVGTIHLTYTVQGFAFTPGTFGSFDVNWQDAAYGSNPATNYAAGINFNLFQNQAHPSLVLTPSPGTFAVTATGQSGSSHVTISIANSVAADPSQNCDGCQLTATLQSNTDPSGAHLDTVTTIIVKLKLVWPTSCLKVYDFITDQSLVNDITSTDVNLKCKNGSCNVQSTNPYGQWSENVLLVNTCNDPKSFDLKIGLDRHFGTNPEGNPGNATFIYTAHDTIDPDNFDITAFGAGQKQGEALCLANLSVGGGDSFLATVHMGIYKGAWDGGSTGAFGFSGEIDVANSVALSSCSGGTLHPEVAKPNPATATVTYTEK